MKENDAKLETMKDDDWEELELKYVSTIWLCIANCIINNVMDEDLSWLGQGVERKGCKIKDGER